MSDELKAIYAAERDAIITVRKSNPGVGPYALARFIKNEYRSGSPDYAVSGQRPELSILGVIRRYDKRGYYANGGEMRAAARRRHNERGHLATRIAR